MKVLLNQAGRRIGVPIRPAIIMDANAAIKVDEQQVEQIKSNKASARWLERGVLVLTDEGDEVALAKASSVQEPLKPLPPRRKPLSRAKDDKREEVQLPDGLTGEGVEKHHAGGGWWEVWVNGFKVTDRNVRKEEAESIAAEYEQ